MAHGYLCGASTRPGQCPSCGGSIFYFSCDCGSKVFFDDLGGDWPRHNCTSDWVRSLVKIVESDGRIVVDLGDGIFAQRPGKSSGPVRATKPRSPRPASLDMPIVRVAPGTSEPREITGVLREVSHDASLLKSLDLGDTVMTREMLAAQLGPEWAKNLGRITVHSIREGSDQRESYTAWVPAAQIADPRIRKDTMVSILLASVDVLGMGSEWLCAHLSIIE